MRLIWAVLILIGCLVPSVSRAASAISLSPATHDVVISETTPVAELRFTLTNSTDATVDVGLSAVDFGALGETGGIAFLGQEESSWQHRLTPWLTIQPGQINLVPGATESVTVKISDRDDMTPGGHYAAVLAEIIDSIGADDPGALKVGWQGILSSQFYVLKKGGEIYDLNLLDIRPNGFIGRPLSSVNLRWRADGNTHVKPYGTVEIISWRGQRVAKGVINDDSALILPGSTRVLTTELKSRMFWWPGKYEVVVNYHHQDSEELIKEQSTLWYLPVWWLLLLLPVLIWMARRRRG